MAAPDVILYIHTASSARAFLLEGKVAYEFNQLFIAESFQALYLDCRGRSTLSREDLQARQEVCEGLAQSLSEHCLALRFRSDAPAADVMTQLHEGLLERAKRRRARPLTRLWRRGQQSNRPRGHPKKTPTTFRSRLFFPSRRYVCDTRWLNNANCTSRNPTAASGCARGET